MAFPDSALDAVVELAIGADIHAAPGTWSWTDVTVREASKVTINRGRRNRIGNFPATRVQATADNTNGDLCRHNPFSQYFGLLKKNTPMRVRVNNGSGYVTRAAVYVPGFPPSWDPSERDQTVTLQGVGITDRLARSKPLRSAMYRKISATASAYWPMEDGTSATSAASGIAGGSPAVVVGGTVEFGRTSLVPGGSDAAADLSAGGQMTAPTGISSGAVASWEMECVFAWDAIPTDSNKANTIVGMSTPGSAISEWGIGTFESTGTTRFGIYRITAATGAISLGFGSAAITVDTVNHFRIKMTQNGGNVDYERWLNGVLIGSGSEAGVTLTAPTNARWNSDGSADQMPQSMCQVAVWVPARSTADSYLAVDGYAGEMAHERVERLCDEERVPVTVTASTSQAMGPQSSSRLLDLLRECANADQGLLYENLDFGLTFVSSSERYNLDPSITLAYDSGHILPPWDPDDDDQDYYNQVTASRPGGSSATEADDDEIDDVGLFSDQINPNVETDGQLANIAGWRLNLGLNDELTWPAVRVKAILGGSLLDDWLATDLGSQLHVTGHPSPLAPQTIRQLVEGYTETLGSFTYDVSANLSPASPWDVGVYGVDPGGVVSRPGAATTFLAEDLTTVETAADVTTGGETWATTALNPTAFPFNVDIGGLTYSCTGITGSGSSYTLTLVRLATDKAHSTGAQVTVTDTDSYGL